MTEGQIAALRWLAGTPSGSAWAREIPEAHFRSLISLRAVKLGRRSLVSEKKRGVWPAMTITAAGRAALAEHQ